MSNTKESKSTMVQQHTGSIKLKSGLVAWKSPSNIAIVKYWGKHGEQLPANPSLSLTLSEANTTTEVAYQPGSGNVSFLFEGESNDPFERRVADYIKRLSRHNAFLSSLDLEIRSRNSFPHSAGIASSASSMSALALCIGSIAYANQEKEIDGDFWRVASYNARLGSGSAARSIKGPVMIWGKVDEVEGSSDQYAIEAPSIHPVFNTYKDTILIVDQDEKQVKSSVGHALMHNHPYAQQRFRRAHSHMHDLLIAMKSGDVQTFGRIAEAEAFDLHSMMMTSNPPYLLIKPNTVSVINALHEYRADTGHPVFMTLDAGPNVHLLYPEEAAVMVDEWIDAVLKDYCFDGKMIHDQVGLGPERIER